jgi:ribosomal protein L37AE/L43A
MGSMVSGRCDCGYSVQSLLVGVGMSTPLGVLLETCLCRQCSKVISTNVRAKPLVCPECQSEKITPYSDLESVKDECEDSTRRERRASQRLFYDKFECPACGSKSLRFSSTGVWD